MQARRINGSGCRVRGGVVLAAAVLTGVGLAGCGSSPPKAAGPVRCGTTRTAANSPVEIMVQRGSVACSTALAVERNYAAAIRDGKAAGNGGGSPVTVDGWTCQGFTTPVVLKTGETSKCIKDSTELLAVLDIPASS
jgi:hypothetical protein